MRRLKASDYTVMPWKNGGGTTTEIAIHPIGARVSDLSFLWRLSIADVARSGPFSRFPGYDRHIVVIGGPGMMLDAGSHGCLPLKPLAPARFSGDWDVAGTLEDGPVRDFNLIARRDRVASSLTVLILADETEITAGNETLALHVLDGDADGLAPGDTVVLDRFERFEVKPGEPLRLVRAAMAMGREP